MSKESISTFGNEQEDKNHFERAKKLLAQFKDFERKDEKLGEEIQKMKSYEDRVEALKEVRRSKYDIALKIYQEWELAGKPGTGLFEDQEERKHALELLMDFGPWKKISPFPGPIKTVQEHYADSQVPGEYLLIYCPDKVAEINRIIGIVNTSEKEGTNFKRGLNKWASITNPRGGLSQFFKEPEFSGELFQID